MNTLQIPLKNRFLKEQTAKKICILFLLLLPFIILSCGRETADQSISANSETVLKESELPKGRPALENTPISLSTAKTAAVPYGYNGAKKNDNKKIEELPEETLRKKFQNLLIFHADDTMQVNMPKLATLILSRNESINKLRVEVLEESDAKDEKVKLDTTMEFGSKMKAKLISFGDSRLDNTFNIEPLGDDVQSFRDGRKKILWQWKITPLKPGKHELKLSIQVIEKDGEAISLPARNISVVIFAKSESILSGVGHFLEKYWQFLITAIMIPIISAYITTLIKQRNTRQPSSVPSSPAQSPENVTAYKRKRKPAKKSI